MSLTGLPVISVLAFPLRGKAAVVFILLKEDGTALLLDPSYLYNLSVSKNPDSATLFTLTQGAGITLVTPYSGGQINIALTNPQIAMLSTLRLYAFLLTVTDLSANVILTMAGRLMPVNELPSKSSLSIAGGGGTTTLSTAYVNTVTLSGVAGGTGYLDGLATVSQTVGCILEYIDSNGQVRGWILETSTQATVVDAYQRPLDFNSSTNPKVWRSLY